MEGRCGCFECISNEKWVVVSSIFEKSGDSGRSRSRCRCRSICLRWVTRELSLWNAEDFRGDGMEGRCGCCECISNETWVVVSSIFEKSGDTGRSRSRCRCRSICLRWVAQELSHWARELSQCGQCLSHKLNFHHTTRTHRSVYVQFNSDCRLVTLQQSSEPFTGVRRVQRALLV